MEAQEPSSFVSGATSVVDGDLDLRTCTTLEKCGNKVPDNAKNMNQARSKIDSSHMLVDGSISEGREKITSDQSPNSNTPPLESVPAN
jgi:hypothetical protein